MLDNTFKLKWSCSRVHLPVPKLLKEVSTFLTRSARKGSYFTYQVSSYLAFYQPKNSWKSKGFANILGSCNLDSYDTCPEKKNINYAYFEVKDSVNCVLRQENYIWKWQKVYGITAWYVIIECILIFAKNLEDLVYTYTDSIKSFIKCTLTTHHRSFKLKWSRSRMH